MADVSVVIPVRNAGRILDECIASVVAEQPREVIVVDGLSTDDTVEIARRHGATVLSDEGRGLPAARMMGAEAASSELVALIDADVVLPSGSLAALVEQFRSEGYAALQAGLHSVSVEPGDYWGEALAHHHRTGRSKSWFGLVATIFERRTLLEHGFDAAFGSGEDIELRWRLQQNGQKVGVSSKVVVTHRFEAGYRFARGQWDMDGRGLAKMVRKHRLRGLPLAGLPLAGAVRGILLSLLRREPKWIPYFLCYMIFNYVAMVQEMTSKERPERVPAAVAGRAA